MIPFELCGRPLKIVHGFGFRREDGKARREEIIDGVLERLFRLGYGGIVTNVDLDQYLESDANWESLRYAVRRAKEYGFRVWLYDEHGYPSGGAGGITLRNHPEYEAKALVKVTATGLPGEIVDIALPARHEKFIYPETGMTASAKADANGIARAYAIKRLYEGTHAEHNVHESRRYINVLDPDAIKAFIDNTYEAYRRELGGLFNEIEAIFTDEPSIMAAYLNAGLYPGRVRDEFDDSMPLLPLVVWDDRLPEKYAEKWGEELLPRLGDLFGEPDDANRVTRFRFFSTTSEMYENAFFRQLGDWCASAGTNFSGHVLLEEEILHHPLFEGNIFRFVSHMGIPGIDMLTTIPEGILRQAPTPKLISSAAHWHDKPGVMSEVSAHMQGGIKPPLGVREMKGSVALQRALGVTYFPSYYSDTAISENEFRDFCDFTANICRLLEPAYGSRISAMVNRTLLLYPIEAAFASSSGSAEQLGSRKHSDDERRLETSWQLLNRELLLAGIGYECVDAATLLEAKTHIEHRGVYNADSCFRAVILPYMNFEADNVHQLEAKLTKAGVITVRDEAGTPESVKAAVEALRTELFDKEGIMPNGTFEAEAATPSDPCADSPLIISAFRDTRHFELAFLLVNYTSAPVSGTVSLNLPCWTGIKPGNHAIMVDPDNGVFTLCDGCFSAVTPDSDRTEYVFSFKAELRPMGALVVGFN